MMRRGFTIIELLVASLLLGMLISVLTMVFSQSSIAWRTGVAGVADLDTVRQNVAEIRDEADNAYVWNNEVHRLLGLWDSHGKLRQRAWDVGGGLDENDHAKFLQARGGSLGDSMTLKDIKLISVGSGDAGGSFKTYMVNVMSAGPDKEFNTWDDIWSYPDEFD